MTQWSYPCTSTQITKTWWTPSIQMMEQLQPMSNYRAHPNVPKPELDNWGFGLPNSPNTRWRPNSKATRKITLVHFEKHLSFRDQRSNLGAPKRKKKGSNCKTNTWLSMTGRTQHNKGITKWVFQEIGEKEVMNIESTVCKLYCFFILIQ